MYKPLHVLATIVVLLVSLSSRAQQYPPNQPEQDPCGALPICGGSFTTPYSYSGIGQYNHMSQGAGGCYDESDAVWLKIEVATAGDVMFTINPTIPTNDYDFTVFDMTNTACADLSYAQMIRCNGSQYGFTGLSPSGSGTYSPPGPFPAFNIPIAANAGDIFYILINNWTTVGVAGFTIDFAGSTATFVSGPTPEFGSIVGACTYTDSLTIQMTKPVQCGSIAPDGSDFAITGGTVTSAVGLYCTTGGYADKIRLYFSSPLPIGTHTISGQVGSDGNTLLDLCDNALVIPETIDVNVVSPTPPAMVSVDDPACIVARIHFDRPIDCGTIASNGSDFTVSGPGPVSVIKAMPVSCTADGMTDTVEIYFSQSIFTPGTYTISVQNGTDGDGVADTCGFSVVNTVNFNVSDAGGVTATASPSVLCEPGYVTLDAQALVPPPSASLSCGGHTGLVLGVPTTHTVGTGSSGTTSYTPFYGLYEDARIQILYSAAELQAAGITTSATLTSLRFNITSKSSTAPYNNFTIKMGCTNLTSLSGFVGGLTPVYGPTSFTSAVGNNNFTLTTPYDWDGTSNVIVEICFDNTDWTNSDAVQYTATTGVNTVFHRHDDGVTGCAMTNTAGFGGTSVNRPNITFSAVPPPPGGYGFRWSPSDFVADTTQQNTTAFVPKTTTYQIQIMDTNRCYRRATAQVIVSERSPVITPSGDTAICAGEAIQLHASGGVSYEWYPAAGLSCTTCPDPVASPSSSTVYSVVISDQHGCSDTLNLDVTVHQLPLVQATPDSLVVKYGTTVQLNVSGADQYLWSPVITPMNPTSPNPSVTVTEPVRIVVQGLDTNKCVNTDTVRLGVDYRDHLMVPSAFSPNGDGKNDLFRIANLTFQKVQEFRVFNRWGQEVYSTTDGKQGWDGTWKGALQDPGVYQFIIRVAYPDGYVETYKGNVTLVR